jgi:NAD+ diphosphatase
VSLPSSRERDAATDVGSVNSDARWFTREEVTAVLNHRTGTKFGKSDYKKMAEIVEGKPTEDKTNTEAAAQALTPPTNIPPKPVGEQTTSSDDPPFRLPPVTAIAGALIRDWIDGKIGFFDEPLKKGNL